MENVTYKYLNNRKLRFNYYIEETYISGISLSGFEVKSLRSGWVDLSEAYCIFTKSGELILKNCYIYKYNNIVYTREENIDRKLLLTKKELKHLRKRADVPGFSILPIAFMVPSFGCIKLKIGLCKGKKKYDKRETIKKRDLERENKHYKL